MRRHGQTLLSALGVVLGFLCILTGFWHQQTAGWQADRTMLIISVVFGVVHIGYFLVRFKTVKTPAGTDGGLKTLK